MCYYSCSEHDLRANYVKTDERDVNRRTGAEIDDEINRAVDSGGRGGK
jgi:hypothetical protein